MSSLSPRQSPDWCFLKVSLCYSLCPRPTQWVVLADTLRFPPLISCFPWLKKCTLGPLVSASQTQTFPVRKCSRPQSLWRVVFKAVCTLHCSSNNMQPGTKRGRDDKLSLSYLKLAASHSFSHTWCMFVTLNLWGRESLSFRSHEHATFRQHWDDSQQTSSQTGVSWNKSPSWPTWCIILKQPDKNKGFILDRKPKWTFACIYSHTPGYNNGHMEAIRPPRTACAKPTVCMCLCLHVRDKLLFDSAAKTSQP